MRIRNTNLFHFPTAIQLFLILTCCQGRYKFSLRRWHYCVLELICSITRLLLPVVFKYLSTKLKTLYVTENVTFLSFHCIVVDVLCAPLYKKTITANVLLRYVCRFVMIRLDNYEMYGYETSLVSCEARS